MIAVEHRNKIDFNLPQHEVLDIIHPHPGMTIECEQGIVWITSTGDINDHTLLAGETYIVDNSGSLVIEAVKDAVVNVREPKEEAALHTVS